MAESEREKIAAIVVTYNRKELLGECLDSLLQQSHRLDAVYLIDNCSTDGTYDDLLARGLIAPVEDRAAAPSETVRPVELPALPDKWAQVHYVRMPENTGGAGGFHEGMKRAVAAGFDWLWVMDDDLLTSPDALKALIEKKEALEAAQGRSFVLNSLVLSRDHMDYDRLAVPLQALSKRGYPKVRVYYWRLSEIQDKITDGLYRWACPFNGTLVPASVVAAVGLPNKEFFIKGDEKDFLWRAAKTYSIYTVVDSKVFHPTAQREAFDWKQYYNIRNMIIVNRHFNFPALRNFRLIVLSLGMGLRHGRRGLRLVLRAIRDGLSGRLGKREAIHTWLHTS